MRRIKVYGVAMPTMFYGATIMQVHDDVFTLHDWMVMQMMDLPMDESKELNDSTRRALLRFLGFPSVEQHLADLMKMFEDRLKASPYPIIHRCALAAMQSNLPWNRYRKQVLEELRTDEQAKECQKHPAFKTESCDVDLIFKFALPEFPRSGGTTRCPVCANKCDSGWHVLNECTEERVVAKREGFLAKYRITLWQMVDWDNPFNDYRNLEAPPAPWVVLMNTLDHIYQRRTKALTDMV